MPLCLYTMHGNESPRLGLIAGDHVLDLEETGEPASLAEALAMSASDLRERLDTALVAGPAGHPHSVVHCVAPIDRQEVWAAGVTYLRSRDARMEESTEQDVYERVYDAERPEVFLKATPDRVSGPGEAIAIRGDSTWDVPEPELVLVINRDGETVGYTVGNDVSSRSIEGENPIYLPQAKIYSACAALGPVIALAWEVPRVDDLAIRLIIRRNGEVFFEEETSTSQIHRPFSVLTDYLRRYQRFDHGVFLMTGTGIIPPSEFTLEDGDDVEISIDQVGTLRNPVRRLDRVG
ncbi:MAG TPA: fumarylacetoacetate hydrolase family protein [Thermomicrobiales bacterium]|nr:fumarylacetoacetate hydrolase family protein [Thermomicrobiales bacterium]